MNKTITIIQDHDAKDDLWVALASNGHDGFIPSLRNDDGSLQMLSDIDHEGTAAEVCLLAAAQLRAAAKRFDRLAKAKKPTHGTTHERINGRPEPEF